MRNPWNWAKERKPENRESHPAGAPVPLAALCFLAAGLALVNLGPAFGQQVHRDSFESREPRWVKGNGDTPFRETAHDLTDQTAHSGQHAERLLLTAEQGTFIHYAYPIGRAPVGEDLSASVWVKSNRPGVQLMARLVLPRERSPNSPDDRLTTYLRGDPYQ